jgi:hypothetical protein
MDWPSTDALCRQKFLQTAIILGQLLTIIIIIFNLRTAAFKAYCAIWVRRSNFHHQATPRVSTRESLSGGTWNCGREMSKDFA